LKINTTNVTQVFCEVNNFTNCHLSTVGQYQEQHNAVYEIAWSFTVFSNVSLSQSSLLPLFPFSSCMCADCRNVFVVVMSIFMNFYVFKKNGNIGGHC